MTGAPVMLQVVCRPRFGLMNVHKVACQLCCAMMHSIPKSYTQLASAPWHAPVLGMLTSDMLNVSMDMQVHNVCTLDTDTIVRHQFTCP